MSTREILYRDIAFFTDEQIEELAEFVRRIKDKQDKQKRLEEEVNALCGIFHDAADPEKIPLEKTAWERAAVEKYENT